MLTALHSWRGALQPAVPHPLQQVASDLPLTLQGTLFRNGPGRIGQADFQYGHFFDGDGYITKLKFDNGNAFFQSEYVKTNLYKDPTVRRAWTQRPPTLIPTRLANFLQFFHNPSNTSVQMIGNRLFALCEGGPPIEINPLTLKTMNTRPLVKGCYSAHPSVDESTGCIYNVGLKLCPPFALNIVRLSPKGVLQAQTCLPLDGLPFVHDTVLTEDWFIFVVPAHCVPLHAAIDSVLGGKPIGKRSRWDGHSDSTVVIVDKNTFQVIAKTPLPTSTTCHIVNAYKKSSGELVLQISHHSSNADYEAFHRSCADLFTHSFEPHMLCKLYEYSIDVHECTVLKITELEGGNTFELPTIDNRFQGRENRYVFTNSLIDVAGFANGIERFDRLSGRWQTRRFGKGKYAGEAVFVPRSADSQEGDGFLLTYVYNAQTHSTDVEILDAMQIEEPSLATIHLPFHTPHSFHGIWSQ